MADRSSKLPDALLRDLEAWLSDQQKGNLTLSKTGDTIPRIKVRQESFREYDVTA